MKTQSFKNKCPYCMTIMEIHPDGVLRHDDNIVQVNGPFCIVCKYFISVHPKEHILRCKKENQEKIKEILK